MKRFDTFVELVTVVRDNIVASVDCDGLNSSIWDLCPRCISRNYNSVDSGTTRVYTVGCLGRVYYLSEGLRCRRTQDDRHVLYSDGGNSRGLTRISNVNVKGYTWRPRLCFVGDCILHYKSVNSVDGQNRALHCDLVILSGTDSRWRGGDRWDGPCDSFVQHVVTRRILQEVRSYVHDCST